MYLFCLQFLPFSHFHGILFFSMQLLDVYLLSGPSLKTTAHFMHNIQYADYFLKAIQNNYYICYIIKHKVSYVYVFINGDFVFSQCI